MDIRRRTEKNKIINEIRDINGYINTDNTTLNRLKLVTTTDYVIKQINKLTEKNKERKQNIDKLNYRLKCLDNGELDNELEENYKNTQYEIKKKLEEKKKKKEILDHDKVEKINASKLYFESGKQSDRQFKYDSKSVDYALQHFYKSCDSIPDYMIKSLANMPNNKGFIWKGIYCYGELPLEKNKPTIITENIRNGVKKIYEITDKEITIYEKKGQNKKNFISCQTRKNQDTEKNLLSAYIK
jgi:hypothetical protein